MNFYKYIVLCVLCLVIKPNIAFSKEAGEKQKLPDWSIGYFDIHHINTGRGDAAYFIFPDGTEMMFDVGDLGKATLKNHPLLKVAKAKPNNTKQPGEWIVDYIKQVRPKFKALKMDYVTISHFHADHYGNAETRSKPSKSGDFILTGVTELGEHIPIDTLIDRGYPKYDIPENLSEKYGKNFNNYLNFINEKQKVNGLKVEALIVGKNSQIVQKYNPKMYPNFSVRNVKSNGIIWTGHNDDTFDYFNPSVIVDGKGRFNENPLSIALEFSYGNFNYFTGGDMTGLNGTGSSAWFDVETPVGNSVGKVDVLALNHHGNRDATNENFLRSLAPQTIIQQSWVSDHPGGEVAHRIASQFIYSGKREAFATNFQNETKVALGTVVSKLYSSFEGHIVIRVFPKGGEYTIYVLDDNSLNLNVKAVYGPYQSN